MWFCILCSIITSLLAASGTSRNVLATSLYKIHYSHTRLNYLTYKTLSQVRKMRERFSDLHFDIFHEFPSFIEKLRIHLYTKATLCLYAYPNVCVCMYVTYILRNSWTNLAIFMFPGCGFSEIWIFLKMFSKFFKLIKIKILDT